MYLELRGKTMDEVREERKKWATTSPFSSSCLRCEWGMMAPERRGGKFRDFWSSLIMTRSRNDIEKNLLYLYYSLLSFPDVVMAWRKYQKIG